MHCHPLIFTAQLKRYNRYSIYYYTNLPTSHHCQYTLSEQLCLRISSLGRSRPSVDHLRYTYYSEKSVSESAFLHLSIPTEASFEQLSDRLKICSQYATWFARAAVCTVRHICYRFMSGGYEWAVTQHMVPKPSSQLTTPFQITVCNAFPPLSPLFLHIHFLF